MFIGKDQAHNYARSLCVPFGLIHADDVQISNTQKYVSQKGALFLQMLRLHENIPNTCNGQAKGTHQLSTPSPLFIYHQCHAQYITI